MSKSSPRRRARPAANRPATKRRTPIDVEYERGHAAPFSPRSPEISDRDSPAIDEAKGRDEKDGLSARRRKHRDAAGTQTKRDAQVRGKRARGTQ